MSVMVKGEQIRLLELSMIRRYGSQTPYVDPSVARILVNKGLAVYVNKKEPEVKKEEINNEKIDFSDDKLFPVEIISEV